MMLVGAGAAQAYMDSAAAACTQVLCPQALTVSRAAYAGAFLLACAGALLGATLAVGTLLSRSRVVENALRFLGLVGFIAVATYWIVGLALSGLSLVLLRLGASTRVPFVQPGWGTVLSLAAFLLLPVFNLAWRATGREPRVPPAAL